MFYFLPGVLYIVDVADATSEGLTKEGVLSCNVLFFAISSAARGEDRVINKHRIM